jgi:hypothetical protein
MAIAMTTVLPVPVGGHLTALPIKVPTVAGDCDAHPLGGGRFGEPDQRLDRFQLAEEETPRVERLRIAPVLQEPPGDAGHARITRLAPGFDARADLVDQRDLHEDAGVVEGPGIAGGHHVARRPAACHQLKGPRLAIVAPMTLRLLVR